MPLYEYRCEKCGCFEVVQKPGEKQLKANPDCQRKDCPKSAKRLISAPSFQFKGSGWYKTDYSKGTPASSSNSSDNSGSGNTDSKSTPKPDAPAVDTPKKASCGTGCGCH